MAKDISKIPQTVNSSSGKGFQYGFEPWISNPTTKSTKSLNSTLVKAVSQPVISGASQVSAIAKSSTGATQTQATTDVTPKEDQNSTIAKVQKELDSLKGAFYKNNFPTSQKFTKSTQFTNTLMLPVYATAPSVCQVGQVYVNSGTGKLYVCSSANTWSLVGSQV